MILSGFLSENTTLEDFDFFSPYDFKYYCFFFLTPDTVFFYVKYASLFLLALGFRFKLQNVLHCSWNDKGLHMVV